MQKLIQGKATRNRATGFKPISPMKRGLRFLGRCLLAPCIALVFVACGGVSNDPQRSIRPDGSPSTHVEHVDAGVDMESGFSCAVAQELIKRKGAREIDPSETYAHDGDTIITERVSYRLSKVDSAEVEACINGTGWDDQYGVGEHSDINYGRRARSYVDNAIHAAQKIQLLSDGRDPFERVLTHLFVDSQLLPCLLVKNGLAYEAVTQYGFGDHPELAQMILDAAEHAGPPNFVRPEVYRREESRSCEQ